MREFINWVLAIAFFSTLLLTARSAHSSEIIADIWVTKYSLTRGIQHEKAKLEAGGKVAFTETDYYRNGEFELSEKQAVAKAEVMRRKEIQSLQRRLNKLNELRFGDSE